MPPYDNPPPKLSLIITGCFAVLTVLLLFLVPKDSDTAAPQATLTAPPISRDDRVRTIAKAAADNAGLSDLSYEGVQGSDDQNDTGRATGTVSLFVNYRLGSPPLRDRDAAALSAELYQKLFTLDPAVSRIAISFNGPIKDRYGHTADRAYIVYVLGRATFARIDWTGFETESLCAFLRSEDNEDDSCALWPTIDTRGVERP